MRLGLLLAKGVGIKVQTPYWCIRRQLQGQEGLFSGSGLKGLLCNVQGHTNKCVHTDGADLCSWSDRMGFPGCIWWAA